MKEKLLLIGAGGFGRVVMEHAIEQQYDVAFVDDGYDIGVEVCGIKIVGHIEDYALIYANSVVRAMAHVGKRVKIGSNCTINNLKRIEPDQEIDDGVTVR